MPDSSQSNELLPSDPGWDYLNVVPLAINKQTGQREWAVPGILRGAINDLALAATVPGQVASGQMSLQQATPLVPRMALGLAGMGGMGEAPEGALRIFAGRTAKTADTAALSRAMSMESQGHAPGAIWDSTGWMKGPDGQWRFEIPDTHAEIFKAFTPNRAGDIDLSSFDPKREGQNLRDFMYHPDLFKAYPSLENLPVRPNVIAGAKGAYIPSEDSIQLAAQPPEEMLSTSLHEIQHAIQEREGFAAGGSPEDFLTPDFHNQHFMAKQQLSTGLSQAKAAGADPSVVQRAVTKHLVGVPLTENEITHSQLVPEDTLKNIHDALYSLSKLGELRQQATEQYSNLAGEVEARNVQERHASGETGYPPATPFYTPWEQQIVRFDHEGNAIPTHRLIPVEHDPFSAFPVDHDPFNQEPTP